MSGIFGLFNQHAGPVQTEELADMASLLERRGPDRTGTWHDGAVGLGHALLATTPESLFEQLPLRHATSGCVITADVRLDNRPALLADLGIAKRSADIGDAEIILWAYLTWGEACVQRFLGDFAFGIWDPRTNKLFCARDHFGMRPFYYHHMPGRFLAFASEPRAILVLPQTPYRINEGRIADFLVSQLEGIDKTSTFFEEVYRLPPAHTLAVTPDAIRLRRYWTLEPGSKLRLPSDQAYAEALLEVFTEAVRCRLRSAGPVGSMLSGGMDSGSVVAIARELLAQEGRGPLPTFSAVGPDPATCVETRTIHAALSMDGLDPHLVRYDQLDSLMPELEELTWSLDEPFDNHMTLPRAVYLAAHRQGVKVVLDGVGGDIVLSDGDRLTRLLRTGRWGAAYREAAGQTLFYGRHYPVWKQLILSGRTALVPSPVRRLARVVRRPRRAERAASGAMLRRPFAHRVRLSRRLRDLEDLSAHDLPSPGSARALALDHPYLNVGRERYDRVASALAVEPRDPFLDLRVTAFCLALPDDQTLCGGWPKPILRRAMSGRLPHSVCWRRGKEHLGWSFTQALIQRTKESMRLRLDRGWESLTKYVDDGQVRTICRAFFDAGDSAHTDKVYNAAHLAMWLCRWGDRNSAAN